MKTTRVVSLSLSVEEFELYRKLAKQEGKDFSKFVRDKVNAAIKQEVKEANLLNKLIRLIEELPERLQFYVRAGVGVSGEEISQLARLLVYLIKLIELLAEYTIVMEGKRKEFQGRVYELQKALGVDL
jgi:hypothetical protein